MGKSFGKPRCTVSLLPAAVLMLALALFVAPAFGNPDGSYNHGGATCVTCHPSNYTDPVSSTVCETCHTGFTLPAGQMLGGQPETCYTCHYPGDPAMITITAADCQAGCHLNDGGGVITWTHPAHYYGTVTPTCTDCHNEPTSATAPNDSPHHDNVEFNITQKLTIAASSTMFTLGKKVAVKGAATPNLAAPYTRSGKVVATFQRKVGTKWTKVGTASAAINATSGAYSISYKPAKKGSWRVEVKTPASVPFLPKTSVWKTFTVK